MPASTARAIRASVSQILKIDDNWESVDVRGLDVNSLIGRFRNFVVALEAWLHTNPGSAQASSPTLRTSTIPRLISQGLANLLSAMKSRPRSRRTQTPLKRQLAVRVVLFNVPLPGSGAKLVVYPFPVRPNVFAELKLPADLTVDEALRLSAFLKAVALSDGSGGSQ